MATIDMRRAHGTTQGEAAARTRVLLDKFLSERPELVRRIDWHPSGTRANAKGRGFSGRFQITETEILIAIDLAFFARPLKARVETTLDDRINREFGL